MQPEPGIIDMLPTENTSELGYYWRIVYAGTGYVSAWQGPYPELVDARTSCKKFLRASVVDANPQFGKVSV